MTEKSRFGFFIASVVVLVACCPFVAAQPAQDVAAQPSQAIRFAVAHEHLASWCFGYLYIDGDSIWYEVLKPAKDKKHEFRIKRSELQAVGRWNYFNTQTLARYQKNAVEVKFGKSTYHFWWLPEDQVTMGLPYQPDPPDAAPADTVIAAIRNPAPLQNPADSAPEAQPASAPSANYAATAAPVPRGHIGVKVRNLKPTDVQTLGGTGVVIMQLEPDGPAAQAGVRIGDVITAINGTTMSKAAELPAAVLQMPPGSTAQLQLLRDRKPITIKVFVALGESSSIGASDSDEGLPVAGTPPLTREIVNKETQYFEWLLDVQLTQEQRTQIRDSLVAVWKAHRQDQINFVVTEARVLDQFGQKSPEELQLISEQVRGPLLEKIRHQPADAFTRWMLAIYDSAHRPIAPGNPPLTAQVVDAYAEYVSFVVNECLQKNTVKADRQFKDQLAESLVREYSRYSTEQQQQLSQMPLLWKETRLQWTQMSEPQRQLSRKLYEQAIMGMVIDAQLNQLRQSNIPTQASTGDDDSLQHYFDHNNEHQFVKTMSQSSFATTMSLHTNMWIHH